MLLSYLLLIIGVGGALVSVYKMLPAPTRRQSATYHLFFLPFVFFIGAVLLPLEVYWEFDSRTADQAPVGDLAFYFQYYPHVTLYPALFGWIGLLGVSTASRIAWSHHNLRLPLIIGFVVVVSISTTFALVYELRGDSMMLFEFSPKQQSRGALEYMPDRKLDQRQHWASLLGWNEEGQTKQEAEWLRLKEEAKNFLGERSIYEVVRATLADEDLSRLKTPTDEQKILRMLFSFPNWDTRGDVFSISRGMYTINYIYVLGLMLMTLFLTALLPLQRDFMKHSQYVYGVIASCVATCLWIPFRLYYNLRTKDYLFCLEAYPDNYWSGAIKFHLWGFTPTEIFIPFLLGIFSLILAAKYARLTRSTMLLIFQVCVLSLLLILMVFASVRPGQFATVFGLKEQRWELWILWIMISVILYTVGYFLWYSADARPKVERKRLSTWIE